MTGEEIKPIKTKSIELCDVKKLLSAERYTCVLASDYHYLLTSREKGVMPLYHFIQDRLVEDQVRKHPLILADKIIGKAAAYLAIYAGVKSLYTYAISEGAIAILEVHQIKFEYDKKVPYIYNRNKDGQCPMEVALEGITDVNTAYEVLDTFIKNREEKLKIQRECGKDDL